MSLDELATKIVNTNRSSRSRAMSRLSGLIDVTVKGSSDEFSAFIRDFESDVTADGRGSLAEDVAAEVVGRGDRESFAVASSG